MCLKKSYLILLFLSLALLPLFSDVTLTDSDYQKIMTALTESETALETQKKTIETLQAELKQLQNLQTISQQIIEQQSASLERLAKSLKEQRKQQTITRILDHLRGFVGGYFINEYQSNGAK